MVCINNSILISVFIYFIYLGGMEQEVPSSLNESSSIVDKLGIKRKSGNRNDSASKRAKHPAYFIPELAHVVAMCDERLPFVPLAEEVYNLFTLFFFCC